MPTMSTTNAIEIIFCLLSLPVSFPFPPVKQLPPQARDHGCQLLWSITSCSFQYQLGGLYSVPTSKVVRKSLRCPALGPEPTSGPINLTLGTAYSKNMVPYKSYMWNKKKKQFLREELWCYWKKSKYVGEMKEHFFERWVCHGWSHVPMSRRLICVLHSHHLGLCPYYS